MTIEQMLVTEHYRFKLTIASDDLITHSAMQSLSNDEKLYLRQHLLEVANSLVIFMPPSGKLG